MKNTKKLVAIILAVMMVFSAFTVSASAKEMTKDEVVDFYHALLEKTAEKHEKIFVIEDCRYKDYADLSGLTCLDRTATKNEYGFSGKEIENGYSVADYYYGFSAEDKDEHISIYDRFEVEYYIEAEYGVYDASYSGDRIIIDLLKYNDESYSNIVVTIYLTENKGIKKVIEESYSEYSYRSSLKGEIFKLTSECVNEYEISYKPVNPTSVTLSETEVTLGYKDVAEIECIVNPSNATYKGICATYSYSIEMKNQPVNAYEEDGRIIIEAYDEGTATVYVHTLLGDVMEEIEVTVEYSAFDRIHVMFDEMIENIKNILGLNTSYVA